MMSASLSFLNRGEVFLFPNIHCGILSFYHSPFVPSLLLWICVGWWFDYLELWKCGSIVFFWVTLWYASEPCCLCVTEWSLCYWVSLWVVVMCIHVLVWRLKSGRGPELANKPREERNLMDRSREVGKSFMHTMKSTRREGMAWGNCVALKRILHCVGWYSCCGGQDRFCVGAHSSVVELTKLSIHLSTSLAAW